MVTVMIAAAFKSAAAVHVAYAMAIVISVGLDVGKIIYLMGKSSSGKDTIFKRLLSNTSLGLKTIVPYTTRPIRSGEKDGLEYFSAKPATAAAQELMGAMMHTGAAVASMI